VEDATTIIRWSARYNDTLRGFSRKGLEYGDTGLVRWNHWSEKTYWFHDEQAGGSDPEPAEDPPGYSENFTHDSLPTGTLPCPMTVETTELASLHPRSRVSHSSYHEEGLPYPSSMHVQNMFPSTGKVNQTGLSNTFAATSAVPSWEAYFERSLLIDPFNPES
jgi:hypothetical protein